MESSQSTAIICHASEDKNSFVLPFAYKLAEYGIKTLVDEWEIRPNESLIERIFTEGIKQADAFVIFLSNLSINKPWITEELRAGLVKRISVHCKMIPLIIEDAVLPEVLANTEWVKITDLDNYDREIKQIARAIRKEPIPAATPEAVRPAAGATEYRPSGAIATPGVGAVAPVVRPAPATTTIPGLSPEEVHILKVSSEYAVEKNRTFINTSDIRPTLEQSGLTPQKINKCLDILDENGLIKAARILGSANIEIYNVTPFGFEAYARAFIPDYNNLYRGMLFGLANEGLSTNDDLSTRFDLPMSVVNFTLDVFESRNLIKKGKSVGGAVLVKEVTEAGKRLLQS
jgi:hypothetical protein